MATASTVQRYAAIKQQIQNLASEGDPRSRFRAFQRLGTGGFGDVWRASDTQTSGVVAIKMIRASTRANDLQRILNEIEILKQCQANPNITKFMDLFMSRDQPWIVMECVNGLDMRAVYTHMQLSPSHVAYVCKAILKALRFLHTELRVIHRDIKPANILVSRCGHVKLTDFGLSIKPSPSSSLSMCVGTKRFMAPELVTSTDYSFGVDIWSLAMTVYVLTERINPYDGIALAELTADIASRRYIPSLCDMRTPGNMKAFYNSCVEEPERRPTASALLRHSWLRHTARLSVQEMSLVATNAHHAPSHHRR